MPDATPDGFRIQRTVDALHEFHKHGSRHQELKMKDMQAHLEKLRVEAEDCELISKLAAHHRALPDEVGRTMKASA
ncbi:hypothetical protein [Bradyrhizobium sp. USDA 3315]